MVSSLSLVELMLCLCMLTVEARHERLQLLLDKLGLDVANLLFLLMDMESSAHLSILCVDDSQTFLKLVLVDLNLRQVGVDHLHGMLTSSRIGHYVIPVL